MRWRRRVIARHRRALRRESAALAVVVRDEIRRRLARYVDVPLDRAAKLRIHMKIGQVLIDENLASLRASVGL